MNDGRLNRRRFLSTAASGALAGSTLGGLQEARGQQQVIRTQVVVIGAGLAGVTAGHWLKEFGFSTVVIEARKRIGGRIFTSRHFQDVPFDLGAAFVHDADFSPITQVADFYNIPRVNKTPFLNFTMSRPDGKLFTDQEILETGLLYADVFLKSKLDTAALWAQKVPDQPLANVIDPRIAELKLSPERLAALNVFLDLNLASRYTGEFRELSTYFYDQETNRLGVKDPTFVHGFGEVVDKIAFGVPILNERVCRRISYGPGGVTVATDKETFQATYAVIAVPLGVLQSGAIEFQPALPSWKTTAMSHLGPGVVDKHVLRFPKGQMFWDPKPTFLLRAAEEFGAFDYWFNASLVTGQPIFVAFVDNDFAKMLGGKTDGDVVQMMMSVLRRWYGPNIPWPIDYQRSNWGREEFSQGSVSHVRPGGSGLDYDVMAHPVPYAPGLPATANRLFFCGEATHRQKPSSTYGAYDSGRREAFRIHTLNRRPIR